MRFRTLTQRYWLIEKHGDVYIGRDSDGKWDRNHIEKVVKEYKFIYKCSRSFRRVEHNEAFSHCLIVLSNEDYTNIINFLKSYHECRYINDFKKVRTLYKIKEKINEI